MAKKPDIEKIFRDAFEDYAPEPRPGIWKKISGRLPGRFNLFSIITFVAIIVAIITANNIIDFYPKNQTTQSQVIVQNSINQSEISEEPIPEFPESTNNSQSSFEKSKQTQPQSENTTIKNNRVESNPISNPNTGQPSMKPPAPLSSRSDTAGGIVEFEENRETRITPTIFVSDTSGCPPHTITLWTDDANFRSIEWNQNGEFIGSGREITYSFTDTGKYFISLNIIDNDGKKQSVNQSISIHTPPESLFKMDINTNPDDTRTAYFYNYSENAANYYWEFGDGETSTLSDPVHTYAKPGEYRVKLISRSEKGCLDTLSQTQVLGNSDKPILFPNAFRPNPNGPTGGYYNPANRNNDVFHPYISIEPAEYQLSIYNSAGILVFETQDFNLGWDGYFRQKLQPRGVYIWKVKARFPDGSRFEDMSDVTLL